MKDARWSVQRSADNVEVVRIVGEAQLSRHFVHERSGSDGHELHDFKCHCMITIPVERLLNSQLEDYAKTSTPGSGWSCGSASYKCSFFLPMPVLSCLRQENSMLRDILNDSGELQDYPRNKFQIGRAIHRWGRVRIPCIEEQYMASFWKIREALSAKPDMQQQDVLQLLAKVMPGAS